MNDNKDITDEIYTLNKNKNILYCVRVEIKGLKWMLEKGLMATEFNFYTNRLKELRKKEKYIKDIIIQSENLINGSSDSINSYDE